MEGGALPQAGAARRYYAMNTLMTADLPCSAAVPARHSTLPSIGLPTVLTDIDAARIAAAISAARTESTRTVYAHTWRGWQRWTRSRTWSSAPESRRHSGAAPGPPQPAQH